jgi:hypothetical protein
VASRGKESTGQLNNKDFIKHLVKQFWTSSNLSFIDSLVLIFF